VQRFARFPRLDRDAERRLASASRDGDVRARQRLIEANLRYVAAAAKGLRGYGFPLTELIDEGCLGLLEAARRFDATRGRRFMTYANHWVRAYMLSYVLRSWSLVRMGSTPLVSRLFFGLGRARAKLESQVGSHATELLERLAAALCTTRERIEDMEARLLGGELSLDGPTSSFDPRTLAEQLPDPAGSPEQQLGSQLLHALFQMRVRAAVGRLSERERRIIRGRFLPGDGQSPATLTALGHELGVSRERVRQLEARAKAKLRQALVDLAPLDPAA
jgi:RNA polymerase sigma-32 factor